VLVAVESFYILLPILLCREIPLLVGSGAVVGLLWSFKIIILLV